MTNYKYLKENNLYEAHKAFMRMCEGYGYSPIEEEGNDDQQDPNAQGGMPDPNGGGMPDPNGGGMPDPNAQGGAPDMGGMPDPNGGGMPDPNGGGMADPNAQGGAPDMGGMPDPNGGEPMPPMGDEGMEPAEEDDVIDVDQMTDAQEKTFDRVNNVGKDLGKVDSRIEKLLGAIDKMEDMINNNNSEIADLKREIEKRNPTQTEKLNLRSLDSYPFNIKPTDYWADKEKDSNYSAYSDNDESTTDEYVIRNNDVDDLSERDIERSFVPNNLIQDINKIFGLK